MKTKILKKVAATTAAFALLLGLSAPTYAAGSSDLNITINQGALTIDIVVDATDTTVASPAVPMSAHPFSFYTQTSTGTLGTASEAIRVYNRTATATWAATIAATGGVTSTWSDGGSFVMDFNDAIPANGQLTIDPSTGTITAEAGVITNVALGSNTAFSQGVVDNITLFSAAAGAATYDWFTLQGVSLSQLVPAQQDAATYTLNLTLTVA